jgi:hypothetical protein
VAIPTARLGPLDRYLCMDIYKVVDLLPILPLEPSER